jgi:ferredoxin
MEQDDYDDYVAVVLEGARKRLRELCSSCKAKQAEPDAEAGQVASGRSGLPCVSACPEGALRHSW